MAKNLFGINDMLSTFANKLRERMAQPRETPKPASTAMQIETPNQADMMTRPKMTTVENKDVMKATYSPMSAILLAWARASQDKNNVRNENEKAAMEEYGQRLRKALEADLYKDRANIDVQKETISPNDAAERAQKQASSESSMFNTFSNAVEGQQRMDLAEEKLADKRTSGSRPTSSNVEIDDPIQRAVDNVMGYEGAYSFEDLTPEGQMLVKNEIIANPGKYGKAAGKIVTSKPGKTAAEIAKIEAQTEEAKAKIEGKKQRLPLELKKLETQNKYYNMRTNKYEQDINKTPEEKLQEVYNRKRVEGAAFMGQEMPKVKTSGSTIKSPTSPEPAETPEEKLKRYEDYKKNLNRL